MDKSADEVQQEIFRKMSPQRKLELAEQLWWEARALKKAGLKMLHPEWDEAKIEEETRLAFLLAHS